MSHIVFILQIKYHGRIRSHPQAGLRAAFVLEYLTLHRHGLIDRVVQQEIDLGTAENR